jgi:hypothetical protein
MCQTQSRTTGKILKPAPLRNLSLFTNVMATPPTTLKLKSSHKIRPKASETHRMDRRCTNRLWETAVRATQTLITETPQFASPMMDLPSPGRLHPPSAKRAQPSKKKRHANSWSNSTIIKFWKILRELPRGSYHRKEANRIRPKVQSLL